MDNDCIMVTVDVGIDPIHAFEELADGGGEVFGKGDPDSTWEGGFIVDVALNPAHEVLNVLWSGHLGGLGEATSRVLPKILKPRSAVD